MKAAVLTGLNALALRDAPIPEIKRPDDVLLKMAVVGVCGSDVHYYREGRIGCQVVRYPFAVGHECSAVVERVGPAVTRVRPGDRVAVEPAISCGTCDQCLVGRVHTCRAIRFLGCPDQEGCLAEFIVMPQDCCLRIAPALTLEQAALAEPLSIGLYAVRRALPLKGARVGILGSGPIGLSVLLCARMFGAHAVYMTDKINARLAVAQKAGATWTGNPDAGDIVAEIGMREPLLLDAVFECCGEQSAIDQAVALLKPGGILMLVGIPEIERIAFAIDQARRKELCLRNVRRQCASFEPALALMEQGLLKPDFMITHRFGLDQTGSAFELVAGYRDGVVKALIKLLQEA